MLRIKILFQHVNVTPLDPLHVVQVEHVFANQMLLVSIVHLVSQVIMDFLIAKVKIKHINYLILEKVLMTFKTFLECVCSSSGSNSTSCSSSGDCSCKPNVVGTKCTACEPGYYGFPNCTGEI